MGAVCPSRKSAVEVTKVSKSSEGTVNLEGTANKGGIATPGKALAKDQLSGTRSDRERNAEKHARGKLTPTSSAPLPVKSWRALLEEAEAPDDVKGKPFQALVPKPLARKPVPKKETRNLPVPVREEIAIPSGVTVQTAAYLQLLKEGGVKKKTPLGPVGSRPADQKTELIGPTPITQLASAAPMTAASLRQTWSSALKANLDEQGEDNAKNKACQDDIQMDKLNADHDLSAPVYWSDTESVVKTPRNASAHLFRHGVPGKAIRSYVMQDLSPDIDRVVAMLLARLSRYVEQTRVICPESGRQNRRFVFGLKEVIRRVKQISVSCVIVAPDLESNPAEGGLDDKVREIIATAHEKKIPVIFALSRSRLGQAMGRTMMMSVIGVLDVSGAQDLFDNAIKLAHEGCLSWLARLPAN